MSEFQVVKSRKSKNKKGNHTMNFETLQGMTVSECDVTDVTRKINEAMCTLRTAEFYSETKALVSSLDVEDIVCYGLGNFAECCIARYQLALLMLLREDILQVTQENCYFYDPKSLQVEEEYLQNAGFNVIKENEEGKRCASRRTLFYMPHCGKSLYNNLLWANWTPEQMSRCVVIGNSFRNILDRNPSRKLEETCWYLYNISPCVTEVKLPENFQYTDIFNDTVIMTFPEFSLQEVATHTWEHVQEPKYDDDDLEFVPNKAVIKS